MHITGLSEDSASTTSYVCNSALYCWLIFGFTIETLTIKPVFYLSLVMLLQQRLQQALLCYGIVFSIIHIRWHLLWDLLQEGKREADQNSKEYCTIHQVQSPSRYLTDLTESSPTARKSVHGREERVFLTQFFKCTELK